MGLWVVDSSEAVLGGRTRQLTLGAPAASETETEAPTLSVMESLEGVNGEGSGLAGDLEDLLGGGGGSGGGGSGGDGGGGGGGGDFGEDTCEERPCLVTQL